MPKPPKPAPATPSGVTVVPITDLVSDPANLRRRDPRAKATLRGSVARFGAGRSVVLDKNNVIRAGNGTIEAGIEEGFTEVLVVEPGPGQMVAVRRSDWSPSEAVGYAISDNRTAELAEWDDAGLADTLRALQSEDFDLGAVGFTDDEVNQLCNGVAEGLLATSPADPADAPEPQTDKAAELREKWQTATGQLWVVPSKATPGKEHRLLCGDSTKAGDVARVMGGEKADLCFTSPPYGQQRDYASGGIGDWDVLMRGVFGNLPMADAGQVLVNLGLIHRDGEWIPYWDGWIEWMREQGWRRFGWYVWDQMHGLRGDWSGRCAPSHEFIFHFNKQAKKPEKWIESLHAGEKGGGLRNTDGSIGDVTSDEIQPFKLPDSVWRIQRQKGGIEGHPAPFSVPFASFALKCWPATAYEPFSGSGTTLVAAEQTGRLCRAVEIAPKYVAVALQRLADMGLEPRLS